jgi:hypothetical protein
VTAVLAPAAADAPPEPAADGGVREALVARTALVVVALAVVDDAFIHREPGTSVVDHLAGGLVPAALAVALAVLYPRLRRGVRAIAALTYRAAGGPTASHWEIPRAGHTGGLAAARAEYERHVVDFLDQALLGG